MSELYRLSEAGDSDAKAELIGHYYDCFGPLVESAETRGATRERERIRAKVKTLRTTDSPGPLFTGGLTAGLEAVLAAINASALEPCAWTEDGDGVWQTACGQAFEITADGPAENGMRFCHACGRRLEVKP